MEQIRPQLLSLAKAQRKQQIISACTDSPSEELGHTMYRSLRTLSPLADGSSRAMTPERTPTERAHEARFTLVENRLTKTELDIVELKELTARHDVMHQQFCRVEKKLDELLERIHAVELSPARKHEKAEAVIFTALATGLITYLLTIFLGGQS